MKCTLITGPSGSGKTSLAKFIAKPYSEKEIRVFGTMKIETDRNFVLTVQSFLTPDTRLILVDEVANLSLLRSWLHLAHYDSLSSSKNLVKIITPEIVLTFQTDGPISKMLATKEQRNIKVIDLYGQTESTFQWSGDIRER